MTDIFTDHALEQQQILDVVIVSVVERYTVVSLTGAAGVLAPVTMPTVLELDLELDLVPALLLRVMALNVLETQSIKAAVTTNAVSYSSLFSNDCNMILVLKSDYF